MYFNELLPAVSLCIRQGPAYAGIAGYVDVYFRQVCYLAQASPAFHISNECRRALLEDCAITVYYLVIMHGDNKATAISYSKFDVTRCLLDSLPNQKPWLE